MPLVSTPESEEEMSQWPSKRRLTVPSNCRPTVCSSHRFLYSNSYYFHLSDFLLKFKPLAELIKRLVSRPRKSRPSTVLSLDLARVNQQSHHRPYHQVYSSGECTTVLSVGEYMMSPLPWLPRYIYCVNFLFDLHLKLACNRHSWNPLILTEIINF